MGGKPTAIFAGPDADSLIRRGGKDHIFGGVEEDGGDLLGVALEGLQDSLALSIRNHDVLVVSTGHDPALVMVNVQCLNTGGGCGVEGGVGRLLLELPDFLHCGHTLGNGPLLALLGQFC